MVKVLLVCTGNTCRSPMAAVLLADMAEKAEMADDIIVTSAGISAWQQPASLQAQTVMRQAGLCLDKHCSKQLELKHLQEADLVLTMTNAHKQALLGMVIAAKPELAGKIYTLTEFAGETGDVRDPFGGSETEYHICAQQLQRLLTSAWGKIVKLAGKM